MHGKPGDRTTAETIPSVVGSCRDALNGLPETDYDKTVNFVRVQPQANGMDKEEEEEEEEPGELAAVPAVSLQSPDLQAATRKKTKRREGTAVEAAADAEEVAIAAASANLPTTSTDTAANDEAPEGESNPFFKLPELAGSASETATDTDTPTPAVAALATEVAEPADAVSAAAVKQRESSLPGLAAWRLVCDTEVVSSAHVTDDGQGRPDLVSLQGRVAF